MPEKGDPITVESFHQAVYDQMQEYFLEGSIKLYEALALSYLSMILFVGSFCLYVIAGWEPATYVVLGIALILLAASGRHMWRAFDSDD